MHDQYVYAALPHRPGSVQLSVSAERLAELLKPLSIENALRNFMVSGPFGNQYKRMAVVDQEGNVRSTLARDDVSTSPQQLRGISRFCAGFLSNLPENVEERYDIRYVGRDVGVVTGLLERNGFRVVEVRKYPAFPTVATVLRMAMHLAMARVSRVKVLAQNYSVSRRLKTDMWVRAALR